MTQEPFDLTKLVNAFDLTMETGFNPQQTDGENTIYTHEFKTDINLELNFESDAMAHLLQMPFEQKSIVRMEQKGRFWFDRQFEADVIMTKLELNKETGEATATYNSIDIRDKTNYGKLARFLRWILRR